MPMSEFPFFVDHTFFKLDSIGDDSIMQWCDDDKIYGRFIAGVIHHWQPVTTAIGPGAAGIDAHVRDAVRMIHQKHRGGTILIVGHSNTVPALVKALTGADPGEIAHDSFDQLFVVTTTAPGVGRVVRARYGPR